jgi:hypothetical protein
VPGENFSDEEQVRNSDDGQDGEEVMEERVIEEVDEGEEVYTARSGYEAHRRRTESNASHTHVEEDQLMEDSL